MAKQQRRTVKKVANRPGTSKSRALARKKPAPKKTVAKASPLKGRPAARSSKAPKPSKAPAKTSKPAPKAAPRRPAGSSPAPAAATPPPAPPASRKPGFYEAVAIYERGVQALQRHDYPGAAELFKAVLDRYPEERELLERARLYLRVCERETARQPPGPRTPAERVYAATMALNSGDHAGALEHLQRALTDDPESDHAHYTMAVALGMKGRADEAIEHLRSAIGLNPENRSLARQDPDLENLRTHAQFRGALDTPALARRRSRPRR